MSILQEMIESGALVGWWDFRAGHGLDLSPSGYDGLLPAGVVFNHEGLSSPLAIDAVGSSAEHLAGGFTLAARVCANPHPGGTGLFILGKSNGGSGGGGWALYQSSTDKIVVSLLDGAAPSPAFTTTPTLSIYAWTTVVATWDGTTAAGSIKVYFDGVEVAGAETNYGTPPQNNAFEVAVCGSSAVGGLEFEAPVAWALMANEVLTSTEAAQLTAETLGLFWPSMPMGSTVFLDEGTDESVQYKSDWGTPVSDAAVASGYLEDTGWTVSTGTWRVSMDEIEGQTVKVLECVTAGVIYQPVPSWDQNQHGSWEFWVYKLDASRMTIMFAANNIGTIGVPTNINVDYHTDETIKVKTGFVTIVAGGSASADTWHKVKVTRTLANLFELWVDGVSLGTGTSTPLVESFFWNIEADAGDKISFADEQGDHSIVKYEGVV